MNLSLQLLFHGAIVLPIDRVSGIPYGSGINQKKLSTQAIYLAQSVRWLAFLP